LFDEAIVPDRKHYRLLSINSAMTRQEEFMKREREANSYTIDVNAGIAYLRGQLRFLVSNGYTFQNAVFTAHGSPGSIYFGDESLSWMHFFTRDWRELDVFKLFPAPNTKIYFTGCNVADGNEGWKFLEALCGCSAKATAVFRGVGLR